MNGQEGPSPATSGVSSMDVESMSRSELTSAIIDLSMKLKAMKDQIENYNSETKIMDRIVAERAIKGGRRGGTRPSMQRF